LHHRGQAAQKGDLAQWVDLALKRALSPLNILKGFRAIGIWPLNPTAMDGKMGPTRQFAPAIPNSHVESQGGQFYNFNDSDDENLGNAKRNVETWEEGSASDMDSDGDDDDAIPEDDVGMQTLLGDRVISSQPQQAHFFVADDQAVEGVEREIVGLPAVLEQGEEETPHHPLRREDDQRDAHDHHADFHSERRGGHREHRDAHRHSGGPSNQHPKITVPNFFQLPHVPAAPRKQNRAESLVDYTKSIIMRGDDYIKAMEEKVS
jgi:hypothetical protein